LRATASWTLPDDYIILSQTAAAALTEVAPALSIDGRLQFVRC